MRSPTPNSVDQEIPKIKRKRYTPIILRFGFFHSYWRTLLPTWLPILIQYPFLFLEGAIPLVLSMVPFTALYMLLGPLAVWIIRDTVAGFENLFDIFDEEVEQELKLYTSMDRTSSMVQKDIRSLFVTESANIKFREKIRSILFNPNELILIGLAVLLYIGGAVIFFSLPQAWSYLGATIFPGNFIVTIVFAAAVLLITIFMFGALHLFICIMRTNSILAKSGDDLRLWNYVKRLRRTSKDEKEAMTSYEHFYINAAAIGQFVYRITLRLILTLVIAVILIILVEIQQFLYLRPTVWMLCIGLVAAGFIIFVTPQTGLHNVLSDAKNAVLNGLEERQCQLKVKFLDSLEKRHQERGSRPSNEIKNEELRQDIDTLRGFIQDTEASPTWSFRMPEALKILGASLIPIIIGAIIQAIFPLILISP